MQSRAAHLYHAFPHLPIVSFRQAIPTPGAKGDKKRRTGTFPCGEIESSANFTIRKYGSSLSSLAELLR